MRRLVLIGLCAALMLVVAACGGGGSQAVSSDSVAVVGDRTRVIAGTDCGFGTSAGTELVARDVVWAKMRACSEGAAIASRKLWGRGA